MELGFFPSLTLMQFQAQYPRISNSVVCLVFNSYCLVFSSPCTGFYLSVQISRDWGTKDELVILLLYVDGLSAIYVVDDNVFSYTQLR